MSEGFPSFGEDESKAVLRERLVLLFAQYRVKFTPVMMFITLLGDVAVDCGWHQMTLYPKAGGEAVIRRTRYVEMWRRRTDGTWGVALFIDNADQPPRMADDMLRELQGRASHQSP